LHGGHGLYRDDTPERRRDRHRYYSSFDLDRNYDHHCYHAYRRSDRGYFPNEFKKENPPTFDGEMKKPQDVEAWLLGMRKFSTLHDYSENIVPTLNIKGKAEIWWEYVKNVRCIHEEDFTWSQFHHLFKKKYMSERYFDDKEK